MSEDLLSPEWGEGPWPGVHPSSTDDTQFQRPEWLQSIPNFVHWLVEHIIGLIVQALRGAFIQGPLGSAFTQLEEWAADIPILSDIIHAITGLIGGGLPDLQTFFTNLRGSLFNGIDFLDGGFNGATAISNFIDNLTPSGKLAQLVSGRLKAGQEPQQLLDLLNNIFDGLSGSTGSSGKTLANVLAAFQALIDSGGLIKVTHIPGLDASWIISGTFAQTMISNLVSDLSARALLTDLQTLLNNLFDGHTGNTGSTGKTLADVLTSLQALFDTSGLKSTKLPEALFNNLFDGHTGTTGSTGKTLADVLTSLQDLFNTGGLKPAKTPDITLGMSSALGGTVDNIVNKLRGFDALGWLVSDAGDSLQDTASALASAAAAIAALQAQATNNAISGNSVFVDFTLLPTNSTLPAAFTQTYSGSGTSTLGIRAPGSGLYGAYWTIVTGAARTCQVRYNAMQTLTDYQKVGCSFISSPASSGTSIARNIIKARVNSTDDTYVYVKFSRASWELGCVVSGTPTVFVTNPVSFTFNASAAYWLEAGTSGGLRIFRIWQNSTIMYTHTEVGTTSQAGTSYRYAGLAGVVDYVIAATSPGAITAFTFFDNTPPTLYGSTGKMSRTATGTVTFNSGANLAPTNFFGVNDGTTADLTADLTNGKFTATIAGNYEVSIGYKVSSSNLTANSCVAPVLYKNGSVARVGGDGVQTQAGVTPIQIRFIQSTFKIELSAGDTVQAGYDSTATQTSAFTGEASGTQSYFEIALANRSLS
jgi:hypothetical protein